MASSVSKLANKIAALSRGNQIGLGMGITVALFALAAGLTAAMQSSNPHDEYAFLGYFLMLSIAAGVAGITAVVALTLKLRRVALGIVILDAIPLLVAASCFGVMFSR